MTAILLYDGSCGFCARSVAFVLRHERSTRRTLRFASLQGAMGARIRALHPELDGVDSVIWYEPDADGVLVRSRATLRVLRYLGGPWRVLAALASIPPRRIADMFYDVIARHRHALARGRETCVVPPPEQRARFLDLTAEGSDASR